MPPYQDPLTIQRILRGMRRVAIAVLLLALHAWGASGEEPLMLLEPDGEPVVLRPAAGQTLLLHFWATWCPTCADDLVYLHAAAAACTDDRLRAYAVNVSEDPDAIEAFMTKHAIELPVLRDPKGRVWRDVDGRGVPVNLFWSLEGRSTELGPKTQTQWLSRLASLGCTDTP